MRATLQLAVQTRYALSPRQTAHRSHLRHRAVAYIDQTLSAARATMAPLPSTTQSLTTRLSALSEANKGVGQLIQRLAKLDFQPGSQPLDNSEEGDVRLELSAEIHETLKGIEEELELLRQEVEDVTSQGGITGRRRDSSKDSERSRLAVLLARLTEDLRSYVTTSSPYCILWCGMLTSLHVDRDRNTGKHNSQPSTTPTAQSSRNANSSSPTCNQAPRLHPLRTANESNSRGYQKAKLSLRHLQTSHLLCAEQRS